MIQKSILPRSFSILCEFLLHTLFMSSLEGLIFQIMVDVAKPFIVGGSILCAHNLLYIWISFQIIILADNNNNNNK